MSRLRDDELFKELNRTERSMQAREETLNKLQKRISRKQRHVFPVFLTGILAAAAVVVLTFLLLDSNLQPTMQQGEVTDGMEQKTFEGSGGDWAVEYEVTQQSVEGERQESMRYVLTYHGYDAPETVDYEIQLPDGSVENGSDVPFRMGTIIEGSGTCECEMSADAEPINVTISGNGTTETFDLREKILNALPVAGNGEFWSYAYEPGGFGEKDEFVLSYIGDDQPPEVIDYDIDGIMGGTGGTGHVLDEGQLVQRGELDNLEIYNDNQGIEISVEWDGQSESFTAVP